MIEVPCACGQSYHADDSHIGRTLKCTNCGRLLLIEPPIAVLSGQPQKIQGVSPSNAPIPAKRTSIQTPSKEQWRVIRFATIVTLAIMLLAWWLSSRPGTQEEPPLPACAKGVAPQRPITGEKPEPYGDSEEGDWSVDISNGTSKDAAVRIVDSTTQATVRFVYIRAGGTFKVSGMSSGVYSLRFATGHDWVAPCKDFLAGTEEEEFDDTLNFEFGYTGHYEVTLNAVTGGTARTHHINRERFLSGDQYVTDR